MDSRFNKRVSRELRNLRNNPISNISVTVLGEEKLDFLEALILGADDTPYSGGSFKLSIKLPPEYPYKPPDIKFITRIFHSNVNNDGAICLDLLKHNWSPVHTIENVLLSIMVLMESHNPDDPYNVFAAQMFRESPTLYEEQCRIYTRKFATDNLLITDSSDIIEDPDLQQEYRLIRFHGSTNTISTFSVDAELPDDLDSYPIVSGFVPRPPPPISIPPLSPPISIPPLSPTGSMRESIPGRVLDIVENIVRRPVRYLRRRRIYPESSSDSEQSH